MHNARVRKPPAILHFAFFILHFPVATPSSSPMVLILASAVMPLAKVTMQRQREVELRRVLREMRTAIDRYKDSVDTGLIGGTDVKAGSEGYPPDLETLVEGVTVMNDATGRKLKFLRRIPLDPMTRKPDWGKRSYQDRPDATRLDGTQYRDW
jgi:general secretion pathway protein G